MLQNGPKEPRPRFRLKLFERKLTVPVTGEMAQRLEAESGAEELSVAELIRRCVDIGLPGFGTGGGNARGNRRRKRDTMTAPNLPIPGRGMGEGLPSEKER